jgi:hypothetical protein
VGKINALKSSEAKADGREDGHDLKKGASTKKVKGTASIVFFLLFVFSFFLFVAFCLFVWL